MKKCFLAGLLLPTLAVLCLLACTKDNDPPPEPSDPCPWPEVTTEGKNTLAFKINGEEWVPCVDLFAAIAGTRPIQAIFTETNNENSFNMLGDYNARAYGDSTVSSLSMFFWPLQEGINDVENMTACKFTFFQRDKDGVVNEWELPPSREGLKLEILKLDNINNIAAGIFEAILIPKNGSDTLFITDGRFDVNYYPQ